MMPIPPKFLASKFYSFTFKSILHFKFIHGRNLDECCISHISMSNYSSAIVGSVTNGFCTFIKKLNLSVCLFVSFPLFHWPRDYLSTNTVVLINVGV